MPHSIRTLDGKVHTPFGESDLITIIEHYIGKECADAVEDVIREIAELREENDALSDEIYELHVAIAKIDE